MDYIQNLIDKPRDLFQIFVLLSTKFQGYVRSVTFILITNCGLFIEEKQINSILTDLDVYLSHDENDRFIDKSDYT